jgi:hypothetical protein
LLEGVVVGWILAGVPEGAAHWLAITLIVAAVAGASSAIVACVVFAAMAGTTGRLRFLFALGAGLAAAVIVAALVRPTGGPV